MVLSKEYDTKDIPFDAIQSRVIKVLCFVKYDKYQMPAGLIRIREFGLKAYYAHLHTFYLFLYL